MDLDNLPKGVSLVEAIHLLPKIRELRDEAAHWTAMKLDMIIREIEWAQGCICGRNLPPGRKSHLCDMHPNTRTDRLPPPGRS